MKYMMVFLALVALAGCGTTKSSQSSNTDIKSSTVEQTDISAEEKSESTRQENTERFGSLSENTEREITHIEFDTDKPKDPETGQYPIKSQTTVKETTNSKAHAEEKSAVDEAEKSGSAYQDDSRKDKDTIATQSLESSKVLERKVPWGILAAGLIAIGLAGWCIKKRLF